MKRICKLHETKTGECFTFKSVAEAARFLNRDPHYISSNYAHGVTASHSDTFQRYRIEIVGQRKNPLIVKKWEQPCATCKNFCYGCEWSERGEPVPGWTAEPTTIRAFASRNGEHTTIDSYAIKECPKYVEG